MMSKFLHPTLGSCPAIITIICLLLTNFATSSKDVSISTICRGNPSTKATYIDNIGLLLAELVTEASVPRSQPPLGFSNITVGEDPNRAYGLYNCRGDLDSRLCHDCVVNVTQALSKQEPSYECFGFDDQCMVHYADYSIFSLYERGLLLAYGGRGLPVPDYQQYNKTLSITLEGLIKEASLGNWNRANFATRVTEVMGSNQKIYTLVQCTPDLSPMNCSRCLEEVSSYIPKCCRDAPGGNVIHANCMLKYDNQSFFGGDVGYERNVTCRSNSMLNDLYFCLLILSFLYFII